MDIRLSTRQRDVKDRLDELFTPELFGTLRRLGERPLGGAAGVAALDEAEASARDSVWQVLCDLEIPGLAVPDGSPERQASLVVVAEAMGHCLYASPLLDTATAAELIAAGTSGLGGTGELGGMGGLLAGIAEGRIRVAVAAREDGLSSLDDLPAIGTDGHTCSARRRFVAFAHDVDLLLIAGRTRSGVALALVPRDQSGVEVRRQDDITRGDLYTVTVREATVSCWIGGSPQWSDAGTAYAAALTGARLRQAGYLVGLARGALEVTVDYTRTRQQFGQPVARFQAPAFRLAALHARIAAIGDLVHLGAWQADQGRDATTTAMQALALAGDLARDAASEAVQLHGAYGMTERCDAQRFYRRAALDAIWCDSPTMLRAGLARRLTASTPG